MKSTAAVFVIFAGAGFGQSADRVSTPAAPATSDGIVIKALTLLEPPPPQPETPKQRFRDYVMDTIGPYPIFGEAFSAALGQWRNSPREWGQGWGGYGKRMANNMAYNGIRNTVSYGLAEVFHEDNRYFRSNKSTVKGRVLDALASPATARHPDGHRSVSISSIAGIGAAAGLSMTWAPPSWQGWGNFAYSASTTYAATAGLNVVREFVPDLIRKLRK